MNPSASNPLEALQQKLESRQATIAVVGLGYVGLPLAVELARAYRVIGFDIDAERVDQIRQGHDASREVDSTELATAADNLSLTHREQDMASASVYIIAMPTPIDDARRPDLAPLLGASASVGRQLAPGNVVIYESTVYPGCTEEDCVPVLEAESGLTCVSDNSVSGSGNSRGFYVGYSPERINPGDKKRRLSSVIKVTSGCTPQAADFIDALYGKIVTAGTHRAPSIRVAEAAKVIENTQRDVNIALVNELAMLFNHLGLDTAAILDAAATKWNFLPFQPGLVGGHCIGVDPYYLTHKAQQSGFHPEMILAGRRTNDGMGRHVAREMLRLMAERSVYRPGARVLILGLTFKENCPDIRNSRVIDVVHELGRYNLAVDVHDPWAEPARARREFDLELLEKPDENAYQGIIICLAHNQFKKRGKTGLQRWLAKHGVIDDLKRVLPAGQADASL